MKKIRLIFLILSCCFFNKAVAQYWDSLGTGLSFGIAGVYGDSADNYIYAWGFFTEASSGVTNGFAKFDVTTSTWSKCWDTTESPQIRRMVRYNGELYTAGFFYNAPPVRHFVKWNGTIWDSVGRMDAPNQVWNYLEYQNELYAVGQFQIAGTGANNIAKWNGSTWSTLKDTIFNGPICAMAVYNGEIYIGGNFNNTTTGVSDIAKWNGTNYVNITGGGILGGMDEIVEMNVFNNELYVAGTFSKASGNVGNYIQKWNGSIWTEVGGGVEGIGGSNGQIHDMEVFANDLYVVGVFDSAGVTPQIPVSRIAKWDGTNWCSLGGFFDNGLISLTFKNGDLYVGGGFWTIDGDSINTVAKYIGSGVDSCTNLTGINENIEQLEFDLYPNPAQSSITAEFKNCNSISIVNVLGQTLIELKIDPTETKREIDVSGLVSGVYFLRCGINVDRTTEVVSISKTFLINR